MFKYEEKEFYTDYFRSLDDFELEQEFHLSEDPEEKNLYVGMIKAKECIHPLHVRVEIPMYFPHKKLTFRTLSLSGYPHLIHNGKIKYGDWFCLNTPFGETAEIQLDLEMYRLREWIKRLIRAELPAKIKDPRFTAALQRANTYEWENIDEVNEFRKDADLTFLGNFAEDICKEEKTGFLHCIKTPDGKFYAIRNKDLSNFELPYVIVENSPYNNVLNDIVSLKKNYGWDDNILTHILPQLNLKYKWNHGRYGYDHEGFIVRGFVNGPDLEKGLEELHEKLANKDSLFQIKSKNGSTSTIVLRSLNDDEKEVMHEQIKDFYKDKSAYVKKHAIGDNYIPAIPDDEDIYEYEYGYHSFALGIRNSQAIVWYLCQTNKANIKYDEESINMGKCWLVLQRLCSCGLGHSRAQTIEEKQYFGRGMFSNVLRNKKIAIVGLGAIGSMVAESLARSGVTAIGLWDNDVVEPGNICRSTFRVQDTGENKGRVIKKHLAEINPFVKIEEINAAGLWLWYDDVNYRKYTGGSFYDNINYDSQESAISKLANYDLIIDCTGSNELLHFISYAVPGIDVISLCITNHAKNLLMFSNRDGSPFELRKAYLSKIEQDTKNFYVEGTGCYSPTFLATNSSIATLANMAVGKLNEGMEAEDLHSVILSYDKRGIIADQIKRYQLRGYDIIMTISTETIMDGKDMPDTEDGYLGYLFGGYSADGKQIMVTHIVPSDHALERLEDTFNTSNGILDYIGDYVYSGAEANTFSKEILYTIEEKSANPNINTNNPMLAIRNPDGSLSFFLYINGELVPFEKAQA